MIYGIEIFLGAVVLVLAEWFDWKNRREARKGNKGKGTRT